MHRYLKYLREEQKERWAMGDLVGKTQEETGYKSSIGVAKIDILDELTEDIFELGKVFYDGK